MAKLMPVARCKVKLYRNMMAATLRYSQLHNQAAVVRSQNKLRAQKSTKISAGRLTLTDISAKELLAEGQNPYSKAY